MAKNNATAVDITEKDYVRRTQEEVYIATAKRVLNKHFANAPVDNGQQVILVVREAFKKGDTENPLYFGVLEPTTTTVTLENGISFQFSREKFDNIFIGNKCDTKPGKRGVFVVVKNGDKGYRAKACPMSATSAKQIDKAVFERACQQVVDNIDFTKVTCTDDVVILGNIVTRSQVFSNANRRNLQIEFERPIEFEEDDLAHVMGGFLSLSPSDCQVFLSKKSAVVLWEV